MGFNFAASVTRVLFHFRLLNPQQAIRRSVFHQRPSKQYARTCYLRPSLPDRFPFDAAFMNASKSGCDSSGRAVNSGWNCVPRKNGCFALGSSMAMHLSMDISGGYKFQPQLLVTKYRDLQILIRIDQNQKSTDVQDPELAIHPNGNTLII